MSKAKSAWEDDGGWGDDDWNFDDTNKKTVNKASKEVDYDTLNLNKLSQWEIAEHKKKMDEKFNKNSVKPTDPGYVYDKKI